MNPGHACHVVSGSRINKIIDLSALFYAFIDKGQTVLPDYRGIGGAVNYKEFSP